MDVDDVERETRIAVWLAVRRGKQIHDLGSYACGVAEKLLRAAHRRQRRRPAARPRPLVCPVRRTC